MKNIFTILLLSVGVFLSAQTNYTIQNSTETLNCAIGGVLNDTGGSAGDYGNNESFVMTFCTSNTDVAAIEVLSSTIGTGDFLCIYDGPNTTAPLIYCFNATTSLPSGSEIRAGINNASGCLTIQFVSDASITGSFEFGLSCMVSCQSVIANIATTDPVVNPMDTNYIDLCFEDSVTFFGSAIFNQNNTVYNQSISNSSFYWDFGDGNTDTVLNPTHFYDNSRIYQVSLTVTDSVGCQSINEIPLRVRKSALVDLEFVIPDTVLCLGETEQVSVLRNGGQVEGTLQGDTITFSGSASFVDTVFLPDDSDGNSWNGFSTPIIYPLAIGGYQSGSTLNNINDFVEVCLDIEHSFAGDIDIVIVCPNGQQTFILDNESADNVGGNFFGIPNHTDDFAQPLNPALNPPGTPYTYCWSPAAVLNDMAIEVGNVDPSGAYIADTYNIEGNWTDLLGCPLNGSWEIQILDDFGSDNGWTFQANIQFNPLLLASNDTFPLTYSNISWDPNPNILTPIDTDYISIGTNDVLQNEFYFNVEDQFGCQFRDTLEIYYDVFTVVAPNDTTVCAGDPVNLNTVVTGAAGPFTYSWSPPTDLSNTNTQNPTATLTGGGITYVAAVTSPNNCTFTDTVTVNSAASFEFDAFGDTTICAGDTVQLFTTGGALSYLWTPNNGSISDTSAANPFVFPTTTTTYNVQGDSTGCSQFRNITVTVSNIQVTGVIPTAATCGVANGGMFVFANGQAPGTTLSYVLDGGTPQANGIYNGNLFGGSHLLEISDGTGCPIDTIITIGGGAPLVIDTVILQDATCGNTNDGVIEVILTDTNLIVSYVNDSTGVTQNTGEFTGLAGGTYTITISDGSCPAIDTTITLLQPDAILLSIDASNNITCFNDNDGAISLSATGGSGGFTYAIDGMTYQATGNFAALDSGTYYLSAQDANGCLALDTLVLSTPDSLIVTNLVVDSAVCFGTLGTISFDAMGGTAPYTYSVAPTPNFGNVNVFNEPAGNYSIQVQDFNNCFSAIILDTIFEPAILNLTLDSSFNSNCGLADGSIYVSAAGGTLPYTYSWSDGVNVVATTEDLDTAAAGIYTLTLSDANNCTEQLTQQVFDNTAVTLSIVSFDSVSCFGANDATVTLNADFGTEAYSFTVNNGTPQADSVFTNLAGGLNTFEVTDANACTFTQQITIYEPTAIVLSSSLTDLTCYQANDGTIEINALGGTLPYLFALNTSVMPQISNQFASLAEGTYTAYISDANNCIDSLNNLVINMPDSLLINSIASTDVSCFGNADGELIITATGGTLPYAYSVNGGATQASNTFATLAGGVYNIEVTDSNNCPVATAIDTILEPTQIVLSLDSSKDLTCFGNTNGYIELSATGGTAPYEYSINGGVSYFTANVFNALAAGSYDLLISDDNNCTSTIQNLVLTQPAQIALAGIASDVTCFGSNDGNIVLNNISGGTAPFTVSLNGMPAIPFMANMIFDNLTAMSHNIEITDSLGCQNTFNFLISEETELVLSETAIVDVSCFGLTDGTISVSATGGVPNYNFIFEGTNQTSSNSTPVDFTNLDTGTYPVYVFDANFCSDTILVSVTEPNELLIDSITVLSELSCFGANDAALLVHASGGTLVDTVYGDYTYMWSPSGSTDHKVSGLAPGVHTVSVSDDNACSVSASYTIAAIDPILATIVPDSATINMGDTVSLSVNVQNVFGPLTYSWSPTNGLSCTDCQNPDVTVYNDITYSVVVTDTNGCANYNYTESFIFVNDSLFYFIPNSFTPNGDGINDQFQIFGQDIQSATMMVFNRWGQMVFMGSNQFQTWDGTYQGIDQPAGVYTYTIELTFLNGATVTQNGSITLIR